MHEGTLKRDSFRNKIRAVAPEKEPPILRVQKHRQWVKIPGDIPQPRLTNSNPKKSSEGDVKRAVDQHLGTDSSVHYKRIG